MQSQSGLQPDGRDQANWMDRAFAALMDEAPARVALTTFGAPLTLV